MDRVLQGPMWDPAFFPGQHWSMRYPHDDSPEVEFEVVHVVEEGDETAIYIEQAATRS